MADERVEGPGTGDLARRIVEDLKIIARDEARLARLEIDQGLKRATADVATIVLGGIVALIGFGLLA